jgi:hypothetical protein
MRCLYVPDNFLDRPLDGGRTELEDRLPQTLAACKAKGR